MMKKTIIFCMAAVLFFDRSVKTEEKENYSDEMKIAHTVDLSEDDGVDSVGREDDQKGSPCFKHPDPYHMKPTGTLTLLPKFKMMRQTSEWGCGVNVALMVLQYYRKLGKHNEETLAQLYTNKLKSETTSLQFMIRISEGAGELQIRSTYDYRGSDCDKINLRIVQNLLKKGIPVMATQNDWGGHRQIIIGYDAMETETTQGDVLIVVDSCDATNHSQDGYGIYLVEYFHHNWTMCDFFSKNYGVAERDELFIAAEPRA